MLGIPFDFTAEPVVVKPVRPRHTIHVHAVSPERDALAIVFPRVEGYAYELPEERLTAHFTEDSTLTLTPDLVGPTRTRNEGILGEGVELKPEIVSGMRPASLAFQLARRLLFKHFRAAHESPKVHLLGDLKRIARQWLDEGYLVCTGGTLPGQLLYATVADDACERIHAAIAGATAEQHVRAVLDAYNPKGSTAEVDFRTSKTNRWRTDPSRCHVNWAICDSDWEAKFCRVAESHARVLAYVKNQGMGFTVPYRMGGGAHRYVPDFILRIDDGGDAPLHLVAEVKGRRGEDAKIKAQAMRAFWVPGVNALGTFGRWDFAEFRDVHAMEAELARFIAERTARNAPDLKALLATAPLEGIDLVRVSDVGRQVDF